MAQLVKEEYVRMEVIFKLLNDDNIKHNTKHLIKQAAVISNFVLYGDDARIDIITNAMKSTNPTVISAVDQLLTITQMTSNVDEKAD